jgi:WD40 repeat protein
MVPHARKLIQEFTFERPDCVELSGKSAERLRPGSLSPDGRWLAIPESQRLAVWDLNSGSSPALLAEDMLSTPFFSADSSELFALVGQGPNMQLKAWSVSRPATGMAPPRLVPLPVPELPGLSWAGLFRDCLVLTGEQGVRLLARTNLSNSEERFLKTAAGPAAIATNRGWLAVTHPYSPTVTVYSLPVLDKVAEFKTAANVISVCFSPGDEELTIINRGGLERWDTRTWGLYRREVCSPMSGSYVLYAPDGRGVWRVTSYSDIAFCSGDNLEPILPMPANVVPLCLSSNGRRLVVSVDDQRVQIWDLPQLRQHFRELGVDWNSP